MFSQLSDAQVERLAILAEEAAEVIQVVGKILRHGYDSYHPRDPHRQTNIEHLEEEIGNFANAVRMLVDSGDLSLDAIDAASIEKRETIGKYLHHQPEGCL